MNYVTDLTCVTRTGCTKQMTFMKNKDKKDEKIENKDTTPKTYLNIATGEMLDETGQLKFNFPSEDEMWEYLHAKVDADD